MPVKISYRGMEFTVATPADAAALARELQQEPPRKMGRPAKAKSEKTKIPQSRAARVQLAQTTLFPSDDGDKEHALKFLTMVQQAGPKGVTGEDLMKVLDVKHPKGMGGRMARINNVLAHTGIPIEQIYGNARTAEGRFWTPTKSTHKAVEALRQGE